MPIYKMEGKKDGLQKYRVRVNFTDSSGKAKQLDRVAYGKEEARELESRLLSNFKNEAVKKITLKQLAEEYYKAKKYEIRESTMERTRRALNRYVIPYLGATRIDKLSVPAFRLWKQDIEAIRTNKNEPLAIATKQSIYRTLRALINYAVEMEYIPKNNLIAAGNFKDAYATKSSIDFYTADEFIEFIDKAKEQAETVQRNTSSIAEWNYYAFFMIAFYTGMRKGEINALTWNDIDGSTLHVTKSIYQKLHGEDRETPPKNKSSVRDVEMPNQLKKCLKEHLSRSKKVAGFNNNWRICGGERCLRDTTIEKRNKSYSEAAGIKKIRIHDFRHSHASYLAHCGINIQEIARRLGHSKVEITWNRYSHLYPSEKDRAVQMLNNIGKAKK